MSRSLFLRIVDAVESHDDYFRQKPDASFSNAIIYYYLNVSFSNANHILLFEE